MTTSAIKTVAADDVPETLYGLWWVCDYSGDVPADRLQVASPDRDDPRFSRAGETTYDGTTMASRGTFRVRTHARPKSVTTLVAKFGNRVEFGLTRSGMDIGCWVDGNQHRFDHGSGSWTWDREEREYLWALAAARLGKSFDELLRDA